jgi:hypothetical protein
VIVCWFFLANVNAQKNDTIYLINGDRLSGELKKLEYGLVYLKTDALQTVEIQYDYISTIYSDKTFDMLTTSGRRYYGSIIKSNIPATVNILTPYELIDKPIADIVEIKSLKSSFFDKIDGSVDIGSNYTKSSDVFQFNLATSVTHHTKLYDTKLELNSIITDQQEKDVSRKNDLGVNITRKFLSKWLAGALIKGQQNTELDLKKRLLAGVGAGYDLVRTNSKRFYPMAGLIVNYEQTIDSAVVSTNFEGLISIQYKWFQYRHPKIDVTVGLNFYPSFTIKNRRRVEFETKAKFEIVKDLYFSLSIYDNFDSKPSEGSSSKNDWGIITSVGYTF